MTNCLPSVPILYWNHSWLPKDAQNDPSFSLVVSQPFSFYPLGPHWNVDALRLSFWIPSWIQLAAEACRPFVVLALDLVSLAGPILPSGLVCRPSWVSIPLFPFEESIDC